MNMETLFKYIAEILWIVLGVVVYRDRCAWNKKFNHLADEIEEVLERDRQDDRARPKG